MLNPALSGMSYNISQKNGQCPRYAFYGKTEPHDKSLKPHITDLIGWALENYKEFKH